MIMQEPERKVTLTVSQFDHAQTIAFYVGFGVGVIVSMLGLGLGKLLFGPSFL